MSRRTLQTALALGAVLVLNACATLPFGAGRAPDVRGYKSYDILYATDRAAPDDDERKKGLPYGKRRGPVSYGKATVTVPLAAATLQGKEVPILPLPTEQLDPSEHFTLKHLDPLDAAAFLAQVKFATAGAKPDDVLVYVHGYLNDFRNALFRSRATQARPGVPRPDGSLQLAVSRHGRGLHPGRSQCRMVGV